MADQDKDQAEDEGKKKLRAKTIYFYFSKFVVVKNASNLYNIEF